MTPEQLTEIPGIGEKMVEKIQLSVAEYFQALDNPPVEPESTEGFAEQEAAGDAGEQAEATEESSEAADVAAEENETPAEAEEVAADVSAHKESGSGESPDATGISDEIGNK